MTKTSGRTQKPHGASQTQLSDDQSHKVACLALPDSNTGQMGDSIHCFRSRRYAAERARSLTALRHSSTCAGTTGHCEAATETFTTFSMAAPFSGSSAIRLGAVALPNLLWWQ